MESLGFDSLTDLTTFVNLPPVPDLRMKPPNYNEPSWEDQDDERAEGLDTLAATQEQANVLALPWSLQKPVDQLQVPEISGITSPEISPARKTSETGAGKLIKPEGGRWLVSSVTPELVLTLVVAIFFLYASEGRHPYSFFVILRLVATVGSVFWAIRAYQEGPRGFIWPFSAIALLMNPILPVHMDRQEWKPVDLWIGILAICWCVFRLLWSIRRNSRH